MQAPNLSTHPKIGQSLSHIILIFPCLRFSDIEFRVADSIKLPPSEFVISLVCVHLVAHYIVRVYHIVVWQRASGDSALHVSCIWVESHTHSIVFESFTEVSLHVDQLARKTSHVYEREMLNQTLCSQWFGIGCEKSSKREHDGNILSCVELVENYSSQIGKDVDKGERSVSSILSPSPQPSAGV